MYNKTPKSKPAHLEVVLKYLCASCMWTPSNVLVKLAYDGATIVRQRVASNFKTPKNILTMLASDKHPKVRVGVCDNQATPQALLYMLAGDDCSEVRYAIAHNPGVPRRLLYLLTQDKNPYVAHRALRTLNIQKTSRPSCSRQLECRLRMIIYPHV